MSNAAYVCTDSFHGTVFAILTHRKFVTFYRVNPKVGNSTHSRIDSLLNMFGLSERKFNGDVLAIEQEIDYLKVDEIMAKYRKKSLDFFEKALKLADKNY